jgi:transmembrane sensor
MEQEIQEITLRVLDGTASDSDFKTLVDWMMQSENNRKELEQNEALWNALEIIKNRPKFEPGRGYESFRKHFQIENNTGKSPKIDSGNFYWRIAAGILLIISISTLVLYYTGIQKDKISFFELTTPQGSHTRLTLTDGTTVWLNAGSKLKYPNKFNSKNRTVYLEGEAFFSVKKDPRHPFIVMTSDVNVKALGTAFNVKAYPNEGSIETTLVTGIVEIEGNKSKNNNINTIKLLPSQRAVFIKTTGKLLLNDQEQKELKKASPDKNVNIRLKESIILSQEVNTEIYTSWIENRLVFDNETFESIALKLERRYGAIIIFNDYKIKKYRFSGKFPEISIDRALNALQFASPFKYKIKQDTIYIE